MFTDFNKFAKQINKIFGVTNKELAAERVI